MITRSFSNAFEVQDYTQELLLVPNQWGLLNELNLFSPEPVMTHSIIVEEKENEISLLTDTPRGSRTKMNKDFAAKVRSFVIPHFTLDDYIAPGDVQGKRAYGTADQAETEAMVIARKLKTIRMNHASTLEYARMRTLVSGDIYAPNGTVSGNFYTEFGITRKEIDFLFGTPTSDLRSKIQEGVSHIQDNIKSGEVVTEFVALCNTTFFNQLINHSTMRDAYNNYSSTQEPYRNSLRSGKYNRFSHLGVTFIEYRGSFDGNALIPTVEDGGEAYLIPLGTSETFKTHFSPANHMDFVNTLGEEAYVFINRDPKGRFIEVESETNFLNLVRRPSAVVKFLSSTAA